MREKLLQAYKAHGYEIRCGEAVTSWIGSREFTNESVLKDCASAWRLADPTPELERAIGKIKPGGQVWRRLDTGWGMSWQELAVLEFLAGIWTPRAIFGIGNGFGWSAVAMHILWRHAPILMIDDRTEGADAETAAILALDVASGVGCPMMVRAQSPRDVPWALSPMGGVDLVLIDAQHTDEAQLADYRAVKPFLAPEHVVLFHDVLFCHMQASFTAIAADYPGRSRILRRTTTGMGIVWTADAGRRCAEVFGG